MILLVWGIWEHKTVLIHGFPQDIAAPEEVANSTLHTLQSELARGKGTVPTLLSALLTMLVLTRVP